MVDLLLAPDDDTLSKPGVVKTLADLIVAEVVYVLESVYEVGRDDVADLCRSIASSDKMIVNDLPLLLRTIEIYQTDRPSFADAYLIASAERIGVGTPTPPL